MFDILKAYVQFDRWNCGYVQGMNFLAAELAYHASPETSFCLFIKMMTKYQIIENYTIGLVGLKQRQY